MNKTNSKQKIDELSNDSRILGVHLIQDGTVFPKLKIYTKYGYESQVIKDLAKDESIEVYELVGSRIEVIIL